MTVWFMDGESIQLLSLAPDLFCVSMNGLSKSHRIAGFGLAGWRCRSPRSGVPKAILKDWICYQYASLFQCSFPNRWFQTSLGGHQSVDDCAGGHITNGFIDIPGLSAVKPKNGIYTFSGFFPRSWNVWDRWWWAVCLNFLKQEKILLVHGRGFSWKDPIISGLYICHVWGELAQVQKNDSFLATIPALIKLIKVKREKRNVLLFFITKWNKPKLLNQMVSKLEFFS